jgi:hypothetical protein
MRSMKAFRGLVPALFLVLAIMFGQHAAQLHDLSHAMQGVQQGGQEQYPGSDTCEKCSLYAPFSGAAASFVVAVVAITAAIVAALASFLPALSRTVVSSRSRAPPVSA